LSIHVGDDNSLTGKSPPAGGCEWSAAAIIACRAGSKLFSNGAAEHSLSDDERSLPKKENKR
jgi:hypothetical protein